VDASSERTTADLPNIANIFAPVVPEQNAANLFFKCDATHSCYNDKLWARFYGLYAIDQIALSDALKVRLSVRQNWFTTGVEAATPSPLNAGNVFPCPTIPSGCPLVPGMPVTQYDAPLNWDAGAVYFINPRLSVFGGYSNSTYPIFNTEEPQSV